MALKRIEIRQQCGVEHHGGIRLTDGVKHRRETGHGVALDDARRVSSSNGNCRSKPISILVGFGPHKGFEPADLRGVAKVDRCEIYSNSISHVGRRGWQERQHLLVGGDWYIDRGRFWTQDTSAHIDAVPIEQEE